MTAAAPTPRDSSSASPGIKVLQCIDGLQAGGKERRLVELIKGLRHVTDVRTSLAVLSDRIHYQDVHALGLDIRHLRRRFRKDPSVFLRLALLARELEPDVIHAWGSFASVGAIPAAKIVKAKFVTSMITHAPQRSRLSTSRRFRAALVFPYADAVLANSHAGLEAYRAPSAKSFCVYNGFDFERMTGIEPAGQTRARLGIETRWLVGMVASFSPNKDYSTYLAAAQELLDRGLDATFLAVGDGQTLPSMQQSIRAKWRQRIRFLGRIGRVEPIVNALDVGVLCTDERLHGEGISNSLLEYMAAGKPAIATEGGGTAELLQDGVTGFLVAPRKSSAIAAKVETLLTNHHLQEAMGQAGYQRVREHFSLESMVAKHVEIYRRLANRMAT